jgi:hypothetical protein
MTWGSFLSRSLSLVVILPLILTRFSTEEISLWYLFMILINLQMLVDIGFGPTFSRVIAYAMGGAEIITLKNPTGQNLGQPNWTTIEAIYSTMRYVYVRLNIVRTILLITLGTWSVVKPISLVQNTYSAWLSWGIIIVSSTITFWGNIFNSYLIGVNKVALLRRWETISSIGAILTSCTVLICGSGILGMVIAHQVWQIFNIIRNLWLSRVVENGRLKEYLKRGKNNQVFWAVWPSSWRSGIGAFMSFGLIQASGVLYAQIENAASIATYLLALRLIQAVSSFSQAPFYSRLPVLARFFSEGKKNKLEYLAKRGMTLSHWTYILGFIVVGIVGGPLLDFLGSNAEFPPPMLWALLGFGIFVERFGAMHINLYSTTNHIINHIANGVTGIIYVIASLVLFRFIGIYAFPVGIIIGYLGFYGWYSATHSYDAFNLNFWSFEKTTIIPPFAIFLLYIAGVIFI